MQNAKRRILIISESNGQQLKAPSEMAGTQHRPMVGALAAMDESLKSSLDGQGHTRVLGSQSLQVCYQLGHACQPLQARDDCNQILDAPLSRQIWKRQLREHQINQTASVPH